MSLSPFPARAGIPPPVPPKVPALPHIAALVTANAPTVLVSPALYCGLSLGFLLTKL